jgi:adenylate cyclase
MIRWLQFIFPFAVLLMAVALRWQDPALLADTRLRIFDLYQQLKPRPYFPLPVRVIDIDDATLERIGQWPWPRTKVADLTERLRRAGAAVIAFDIVFAEADRTSPARVLELWPDTPETRKLRPQIESLPDHDRIFADELATANVVTGFALTELEGGRAPAVKAGIAHAGDDPRRFIPSFAGSVTSLPAFEGAAQGNGSLNFFPDHDQIIRRVPLFTKLGEQLYPTLAAEALRVVQAASSYVVRSSGASRKQAFGEHTGIIEVKIGAQYIVPTDRQGQIWLHHTGPVPERTVAAWRIFSGEFDPGAIRNNIVFVGSSATGLKDLRATPLHPTMAGVELHAQVAEQIMAETYLRRPDWAEGVELVGLLAVGLILIYTVFRLGAAWGAVVALAAVAGGTIHSWYLFSDYQMLFAPLYPSITITLVFVSASVSSYLRSESERRQVRSAFGRYMPPVLLERLAEDPAQLKLGGEMRHLTLMFCDIRDFTSISERLGAESLTRLLNRFLTPMTEVIHGQRGMIDKYMGDCIMAFWNAPLDDVEHAAHACHAALQMRSRLAALNTELRDEFGDTIPGSQGLRIGIGINSGICCVGNMGSEQRFDYSVLGDDVNLASRLEGQTKTYGVPIIINETTQIEVPDLAVLELDLVRVKGKSRPARIYGLMGDQALGQDPEFLELQKHHNDLIDAYRRQDWAAARNHLDQARIHCGGLELERFYDLYGQRIAAFEGASPGPRWDGVFEALSK